MYIKIEWSKDGIWGPEGTAGYNTAASLDDMDNEDARRVLYTIIVLSIADPSLYRI